MRSLLLFADCGGHWDLARCGFDRAALAPINVDWRRLKRAWRKTQCFREWQFQHDCAASVPHFEAGLTWFVTLPTSVSPHFYGGAVCLDVCGLEVR